jgi:hypothetical protein
MGGHKTMKCRRVFLSLAVFAFLNISCASTTVTDVWKDQNYQGKAQKILVIMAAKSPDMREIFEGRFAAELENRGNNAIQSYKIIPAEEFTDKELVKSRIKSSDADTVLISRLVDTKTMESYSPGLVYHDWWGYYNIVSANYGYTRDVQVSYIETNLYDVKTGKLIWSGHSKTERTEGEQQLINTFIRIVIRKLASAGVIR